MPAIHVDQEQAIVETVSATDTDGEEINVEGVVIPIIVPIDAAAAEWLDLYDPANQYSPDAATSREIARTVLDALKAIVGAQ